MKKLGVYTPFVCALTLATIIAVALTATHPQATGKRVVFGGKSKTERHRVTVTATPGHPMAGHITVNGRNITYSATLTLTGGQKPEPTSGPSDEDVTISAGCLADLEDDSGADNFGMVAHLVDPNGANVSPDSQSKNQYTSFLEFEPTWSMVNPPAGTFACRIEMYYDSSLLGIDESDAPMVWYVPDYETTRDNGSANWASSPWSTAYLWDVTLYDSGNRNYQGRTVYESDGGGASDTCHYSGSPVPQFTAVPQTQIGIDSNSHYQDQVGWREDAVSCYRGQGSYNGNTCFVTAYDCQFEGTQNMSINVPGSSNVQYQQNILKGGINGGSSGNSVWSERDQHDVSINR